MKELQKRFKNILKFCLAGKCRFTAESKLRTQQVLKCGCNSYDAKKPASKPLSFWLECDVWEYIRQFNVAYSKIYDMGYDRTGCAFCMFGAHLDGEPTRFQRMQITHPELWRFCMRDWEAGGLGLRRVLEYIGIPYEAYRIGERKDGSKKDRGGEAESGGI